MITPTDPPIETPAADASIDPIEPAPGAPAPAPPPARAKGNGNQPPAVRHKVRLRFAKRGDLRLISHHDLMRCLERLVRRARLPLAQSQGFNPRPKIVFPLALGLGIEGQREVVEMELAEPVEPSELLRRVAEQSPAGLDWLEAEALDSRRSSQAEALSYALAVPEGRRETLRAELAGILAADRLPYVRQRPDRTVEIDLRPYLLDAELDAEGLLRFRLKMTQGGSARPEEVVDVLGLKDLMNQGAVLCRTDVHLAT